ncbi:MAG: hypothetical protein H6734_06130 [Alphaproteobacteria bacterium]|nr:hypothetical protein [Alphaproteobacteria bacterium]
MILRAAGTLGGGETMESAHFQFGFDEIAPIPPALAYTMPVSAGTGTCGVELALRIDTGSFPNQDLFVEPVYLTDVAARLADDASAAYSTRFGAASTPDAAAVEDDLQPLVGALLVGGCTVTDSVRNGISGAYDKTELTGTDDDGAVSGTQHLGTRTFGATLGRGTLVGSEGSLFSAQTSGRKLFAETDDGGFFAGRWKRVKGARGVFYGVSGVCHGASDAPTALAGWFDGPLP